MGLGLTGGLIDLSMNMLMKELSELRENKKQRDAKYQGSINLEDLIYRIQLHSVKANIERVKITEEEFIGLCRGVRKEVLRQPGLLRIDGPIFVCTGTLGNYMELSNIIDRCGHPKFMNYLFLGDYAGRYDQSIECLVALFAYRLFMPNNFFLLRGCHETIAQARAYHLRNHLNDFFHSSRAWLEVCETFTALPYAAVVDEKVFCVHGGLSPFLQSLDQINRIPRPLDAADRDLSCDLLWGDPSNLHEGWAESERGIGMSFGSDMVASFLKMHDLMLVCRGHEVAYDGFRFFAEKKMVTITSLSQYCGLTNNSSAVMLVDDHSNVLFKIISERNNYAGGDQDEGLTFVDIVQRKKDREEKRTQEAAQRRQEEQETSKRLQEESGRRLEEGGRKRDSNRENTNQRRTRTRKE